MAEGLSASLDRPVEVDTVGDRSFFGHPRGLSVLFFTEMWERFSFYGMRALLILFMTAAPAAGGLGFDAATAGAVYGLYTSMVYVAALPGGWLADRLLGPRHAVLYGGLLICAGHFSMAVPSLTTFYLGLLLIVLGTGLLKGNVSVLVGRLYATDDARRDAGFSIFYMGINLGAFIAPLVCGYLGQRIDWHLGFGAAGVGMLIGVVQYLLGGHHLGEAGLYPADPGTPALLAAQKRGARRWLLGGTAALLLAALAVGTGVVQVSPGAVADVAGVLLLLLTLACFAWLFLANRWSADERRRLIVVVVLFVAASLFWSAFEQAGTTLNLFADRNTRTTLGGLSFPSSWFQSVNSLFLIAFAPVFAWLWVWLARRRAEPSSTAKFAVGLVLVGAGFATLVGGAVLAERGAMVSPNWLILTYFLHTCGELTLSPVGLSAMTKLSPVRISGLIMGVWFLATAVGNYTGGRIAGLYEAWPLPSLFGVVAAFAVGAGLVLLLLTRPLGRMVGARH